MTKSSDHSLHWLLELDGLNFALEGGYWIKYAVKAVDCSTEQPHGIKYSLTLHDPQGERIFGIDNVHRPKKWSGPAARSKRPVTADHLHRGDRVFAYEFKGAATLLADFDKGVMATLKRKGLKI
jgi:hypothetical protein